MNGPVLRTERLALHPFDEGDVNELLSVFQDRKVRRYLLDDQVVTRAWVAGEVAASESHFQSYGHGLWSLQRSHSREIIGFCGYRFFYEPPELQLACGLLPKDWGQGLATEACRAVVQYGFEELGFGEIRADTDAENERSARLMERLGMTFLKGTVKSGLDTLCYVLTAEEHNVKPDQT